jgi:hypothetical protein
MSAEAAIPSFTSLVGFIDYVRETSGNHSSLSAARSGLVCAPGTLTVMLGLQAQRSSNGLPMWWATTRRSTDLCPMWLLGLLVR